MLGSWRCSPIAVKLRKSIGAPSALSSETIRPVGRQFSSFSVKLSAKILTHCPLHAAAVVPVQIKVGVVGQVDDRVAVAQRPVEDGQGGFSSSKVYLTETIRLPG